LKRVLYRTLSYSNSNYRPKQSRIYDTILKIFCTANAMIFNTWGIGALKTFTFLPVVVFLRVMLSY